MAEEVPNQQGRIRYIDVTPAGAGIEIVAAAPARTRWRFISLRATLTTCATAGTRVPELCIWQGGVEVWRGMPESNLGVGDSSIVVYDSATLYSPATGVTMIKGFTPIGLLLNNGAEISTDTVDFAVGDQWTDAVLTVEEWIEPLA